MTATSVQTLRLRAGIGLGRLAGTLSRRSGRGSGRTIGGRVLLAVAPDALRELGRDRCVVVVSATNGKTTTTRMVAEALGPVGPTVSNADGANLPPGLAETLAGDRTARFAALEVDERFLPAVVRDLHPRVAVIMNLSRDQLDRHNEVRGVSNRWRQALTDARGCTVVANADDPLVAWAAAGAEDVVWVHVGDSWRMDAAACPSCGAVLTTEAEGRWACPTCGFAQPQAAYRVDGTHLLAPDGERLPITLRLPGRVNRGNAAMAAAAAVVAGARLDGALRAIGTIAEVAGRYAEVDVDGRPRRLLLAKNPAGWAEALTMLPEDQPVIVAVNARGADGRDPSWLWDVPFEQLRGRDVLVTGERADDVAVRLHYGEVRHQVERDLRIALRVPTEPAVVLANYTAFQQVRRLTGQGRPGDVTVPA